MLNRGTVLLLVSAIALGGGVLLFENRSGNRQSDQSTGSNIEIPGSSNESQGEAFFPFEEEDITAFSITRMTELNTSDEEPPSSETDAKASAPDASSDEASTELENVASTTPAEETLTEELTFRKQGDDDTWQLVGETDEVEDGAIAFLLSQLTGTADQSLTVEADTLTDFGLVEPIATVAITANEQDYLFHIGGPDFSGGKRYVQAVDKETASSSADQDNETESVQIHLISASILNAVNRPTAEWFVAPETDSAEDDSTNTNSSETDDEDTE
ncbi:MAG: hypothetical protein AAFU53_05540 [Cyanobacteria bacterium J06632_3]